LPSNTIDSLLSPTRGVLEIRTDGVRILDERKLRGSVVDHLVWDAVFGATDEVKDAARWIVRESAIASGAFPASIHEFYAAKGAGRHLDLTVPAINVRGMAYDVARAICRSALRHDVGAVIFEIARTEMGYCDQRPAEYSTVMLAGALKEGWKGPVFVQADHSQLTPKGYAKDPEAETEKIRQLVREAVAGDFLNIDIDASTLVDLSKPSVTEQQRVNFTRTAELAALCREIEPKGVTISIGGEIGEVGTKNSTVEEALAFLEGFRAEFGRRAGGKPGLSKMSIQSGTSHGGVVLPDGSIAKVAIDFDALRNISEAIRAKHGLSGAVQHGASTLPEECFDLFRKNTTTEVHLATEFQNLMYDHEAFPKDLREKIYAHLRSAHADERKPSDTEEQFLYKTRKKGWGPFKREVWSLSETVRTAIRVRLEEKLARLYQKLGVFGSRKAVDETVKPVVHHRPLPKALKAAPVGA
jgi:fructose/tagatose bisphosphate aldolase